MRSSYSKRRGAFTMIELVFVIVVLGIVASIGSEMIAKIYQTYILQRALHRAEIKTELAALQIANRLSAAIPGTVVRKLTTGGASEGIEDPMLLDPNGNSYTVLQWVGADMDSFNAIGRYDRLPGWSGFIDLETSDRTHLDSKGSKLSRASAIISNLGGNINDSAIYFPDESQEINVSSVSGTTIFLENNASRIVEHYKLAWSSYALSVENGDLYLYSHFTPERGGAITDATRSRLLKNVTTFKFRGDGQTIRFKICKSEYIGEDFNVTACKEKAVF